MGCCNCRDVWEVMSPERVEPSPDHRYSDTDDPKRGSRSPKPYLRQGPSVHEVLRRPWRNVVDTFFFLLLSKCTTGVLYICTITKLRWLRTGWRFGTHIHIHTALVVQGSIEVGTTQLEHF